MSAVATRLTPGLIRPPALDAAIAGALAIGLLLQLVLGPAQASPLAVAGGLAVTLPLAWRRAAPLGVALVYAGAAAVQTAAGSDVFAVDPPLAAALVAGAVAFFSLGAGASDRPAVAGLALGVAGMWAAVLLSEHVDLQSFLFSSALIALTPWLAGRAARARELRTRALERERDERARAAAGEERERIARELHDVVAHGVVLMVLQAQGAQRVLDRDPARAREALRAIEETGQTALAEIRGSLGMLGDGEPAAERRPQPGLADLDELVGEMRRAGLRVDLSVRGERRPLADAVDRAAYRVVQEALTNTVKHAGLVPARVEVRFGADDVEVEVADEGAGPARGEDGEPSGRGLAGMRERVRLCGGELDARPGPGGFVVRARLPLRA